MSRRICAWKGNFSFVIIPLTSYAHAQKRYSMTKTRFLLTIWSTKTIRDKSRNKFVNTNNTSIRKYISMLLLFFPGLAAPSLHVPEAAWKVPEKRMRDA